MGFFTRTAKHVKRYQEIITVLVKYGMGDIVRSMKITEAMPFLRKFVPKNTEKLPISDFTRWEEIRMALEELGPTFVKLGQMLSNRPDIIPTELTEQLAELQNNVPPFDGDIAVGIVEAELGGTIDTLFASFNREPVASASIGQVHQATLFDGTEVAVKVQRPDIEATVRTDVEILYTLAGFAENNIEALKYISPKGIIKEFEQHILKEMDYNHERRNLERFRKLYGNDKGLYIPQSYPKLSTRHVFTMEYIRGIKISRIAEEDIQGYDRELIAQSGSRALLNQIFIHGYFHADPHPGNIMIMPDSRVCFIDFGMMGTIMPSQQDVLGSLLIAVQQRDTVGTTNLLLDVTQSPDHPQINEIEYAVQQLIDEYIDLPLDEIDVASVVQSAIDLIYRFKLHFPTNLTLMCKAIAMIEGIGRQIYPEFQLSEMVNSFAPSITRHRLSPKRIINDTSALMLEYKRLLTSFPKDIRSVLSKTRKGQLKMEVEHSGLEPLRSTLDAVSYRLTFGLVLAALIIGSAIMVHISSPQFIHTMGVVGFVIGAVFSVILLALSVFRTFKE